VLSDLAESITLAKACNDRQRATLTLVYALCNFAPLTRREELLSQDDQAMQRIERINARYNLAMTGPEINDTIDAMLHG
jgi:hypothetical protein